MKRIFVFLFLLISSFSFAQICECINCPIVIEDNETLHGEINITTNCTNDLAINPLQQVCFEIEHGYISDLAISLTTPSGLQYIILGDNDNTTFTAPPQENIDICITLGTDNPITDGSVFSCNGPTLNGCLQGNWTVFSDTTNNNAPPTMGPPSPNKNLSDFNVSGSSLAGLWTLDVTDVVGGFEGVLVSWSLTFLDMSCIGPCFMCIPEETSVDTSICFEEVFLFNGVELDEDGTYEGTFYNEMGCDSIVYLTLDVLDENEECDSTVTSIFGLRENSITLVVYPNPTLDFVLVTLPDFGSNNAGLLKVFSLQGKLLKTISCLPIENEPIQITFDELGKGVYILEYQSKDIQDGKIYSAKVVYR